MKQENIDILQAFINGENIEVVQTANWEKYGCQMKRWIDLPATNEIFDFENYKYRIKPKKIYLMFMGKSISDMSKDELIEVIERIEKMYGLGNYYK